MTVSATLNNTNKKAPVGQYDRLFYTGMSIAIGLGLSAAAGAGAGAAGAGAGGGRGGSGAGLKVTFTSIGGPARAANSRSSGTNPSQSNLIR